MKYLASLLLSLAFAFSAFAEPLELAFEDPSLKPLPATVNQALIKAKLLETEEGEKPCKFVGMKIPGKHTEKITIYFAAPEERCRGASASLLVLASEDKGAVKVLLAETGVSLKGEVFGKPGSKITRYDGSAGWSIEQEYTFKDGHYEAGEEKQTTPGESSESPEVQELK